ncbi:MAG TPA: BON domain-containing protein [Blastocatellia bacterium]|nr:BON domain-containing protein [Blastocatellia bacterium]
MRKPILSAVAVIVIIAGAFYYFYGYRNRTISADISSIAASTDDATTTSAVKTALALNKRVSLFDTHVETTNNIVTLTGQVPTDDDKRVVEEVTRGTRGVASVVDNIKVDPKIQAINAEKRYVADLEIKAAWLGYIQNNPDLRSRQITFAVNSGDVKLSGTVQTVEQKTAAELAVKAIPSVSSIDSSALSVVSNTAEAPGKPPNQNADDDTRLASQVTSALDRESALTQTQRIKTRAKGGVVYLSGTVASRAEKALAGAIARSVTGTTAIVNDLEVTGRK